MRSTDPICIRYLFLGVVFSLLLNGCASKNSVPGVADLATADGRGISDQNNGESQALKELFPEAGTCPIDLSLLNGDRPEPDTDQARLDMALDLCNLAQELKQAGQVDQAIKALDDAYAILLKVEERDDPDISRQMDDTRILISRVLLQTSAVKANRFKGGSKEIPLTMNRYVQREIALLTGKERGFFLESYRRSGRYRPMIVRKLKEAGLPQELSWLPLIESGFKTRALSRARALGLWQFIPSTGYRYGLDRNTWIDYRLDPERSTDAAIAYLIDLHALFGDWQTVLAAYNCGEGRVDRVIKAQNKKYLDNFWDIFVQLPYETARYVPRFLATLHILNNPGKYGMVLPEPDKSLAYETVHVKKQMSLKDIAASLGVDAKVIAELNPELRYGVTPDTGFQLRLPKGYREVMLARVDEIKTWKPKPRKPKTRIVRHRVRKGESLGRIAARYGTSVKAIMRANRIRRANHIKVGQVLRIPVKGSYYGSRSRSSKKRIVRHRVRKGESLGRIAARYGTSVKAIMRANHLRSANHIKVGQLLKVPAGRKYYAGKASIRTVRYVVKRGDTLWKIAKKHRVSVSSIKRYNKLRSNCLYIGQVLRIPKG